MTDWLSEKLGQAECSVQASGARWSCTFANGATSEALSGLERQIGESLPGSHRRFLSQHNGARFSIGVSQPIAWSYQVSILSVEDLLQATVQARETLTEVFDVGDLDIRAAASLIAFAEYGASGDRCIFNPNITNGEGEYAVVDAFHEVPHEWSTSVIAVSFEDWLMKMLDSVIVHKQLLEYWTPTSISEVVSGN